MQRRLLPLAVYLFFTAFAFLIGVLAGAPKPDTGHTSGMAVIDTSPPTPASPVSLSSRAPVRPPRPSSSCGFGDNCGDRKAAMNTELRWIDDTRYLHRKLLEIDRPQTAYPIVPPKLMISVQALTGGSLITHFSDRTEIIAVGKRVDLSFSDLQCFLILLESAKSRARFDFGCEEQSGRDTL